MTPPDIINPPPAPKITDYPAAVGVAFAVLFTVALVFVASRFDPTMGVLTISILVVVAFIAVVLFSMFFTIPSGEVTAAVIGGLTAAFGAIVSYFLRRNGREK